MLRFRWLIVAFGLALCGLGMAARHKASAQFSALPIAAARAAHSTLIGAGYRPVFTRSRENAIRSSCQSNLKQINLGILQYAYDYDEVLPPARKWNDVIQPYVKSRQILNCPATPKFGYAANSKLSVQGVNKVEAPAETVSIYETPQLKPNAFGMGERIANRHLDGANYAYNDGHVKWIYKTQKPRFNLKAPR